MKVGTVDSIWRYPVKGMAGERLQRCELDADGLKGDRIWAVQDVHRQEIQSCKFCPQLLQCRARTRGDGTSGFVEITFPDGSLLRCDDPQASAQVPDLDNLPKTMQDFVSLPGTFFLVSPFHILTTSSLHRMK